jgi:hypothetical protein
MKWLPPALAIASVGCAAVAPCPPLRVAPRAVPMTDFKACAPFGPERGPSVIRYRAWSTDSVRQPDRVITGPHTALCEPSAIARGPGGEIYVLNHAPSHSWRAPGQTPSASAWSSWITVYDSSASGDAVPLRTLRIHSTGLSHPTSLAVDRDGALFVTSEVNWLQDSGSVAVFDARADGDVAPLRLLAGPTTGLRRPRGLAVDHRGYVYVFNVEDRRLADSVLVFAPEVAGDTGPCRVLGGELTGSSYPVAVAVDRRSHLYVASVVHRKMEPRNFVRVFDAAAPGTPPLRLLVGSEERMNDGMYQPHRLAIGVGDSLYVRSVTNLSVYGPTDTLGPGRTFFYRAPDHFALDRHDTLYAWSGDTVKVYPPGYTGAEDVVRVLHVPLRTPRGVAGLAVDSRGWLYLVDSAASRILAFAPGASGAVLPARTIAGWRTRLSHPTAIAVDDHDRVYVTSGIRIETGGAIRVYRPGARGEEEPVRILRGPQTGLAGPAAIAFGRDREMYVSQAAGDSSGLVMTHRRGAAGIDSAVARLTGPRTGLRAPTAVAFGPRDTMYVLNPVARSICSIFGFGKPTQPATVTVYAPNAKGDVLPIRSLAVTGGSLAQQPFADGIAELGLAVDSVGRVQVWHPGGSFIYPPGAEGIAAPDHTIKEVAPAETELAAVEVGDGWVYEVRVPPRMSGGSCRGF